MDNAIRRRLNTARKRTKENSKVTDTPEILCSLGKLIDVIKHLRHPYYGCKWDIKQNNSTLIEALIEETFEATQAIEENKTDKLEEEFGDLLFVILMHIYVAEQNALVKFDNVIEKVTDKLIRRHPHIFAELSVSSTDEILMNWEAIKRAEKKNQSAMTVLKDVPRSLPALQRAGRLIDKMDRLTSHKNGKPSMDELLSLLNSGIKNISRAAKTDELNIKLAGLLAVIVYISFLKKIKIEEELQKYIGSLLDSLEPQIEKGINGFFEKIKNTIEK